MTIAEMIKRYNIKIATHPETGETCLKIVNTNAVKRDNALPLIRENKPQIMEYLQTKEAEEQRKTKEREEKIAAIEGLSEIRHAIDDLEEWHYEFERSFDDVGGLGVRPKPVYDIDAMKAQYPRAAAYFRAEELRLKSNYDLSAIGKKALEEVIFGDYETAMKTMDSELEEFAEEHFWD